MILPYSSNTSVFKCSSSSQKRIIPTLLRLFICCFLLEICKATFAFQNYDLTSTSLEAKKSGLTITGTTSDYLGYCVSAAGDINNDGYADIIVGAYKIDTAYVIYGGPTSSLTDFDFSTDTLDPLTTGFMIKGEASGDGFGYTVATAGDFNNDGYDDIIIGAQMKDSSRGAAYVIYGGEKADLLDLDLSITMLNPATTGFTMYGESQGDTFGYAVNSAGDVNKDGYDDIIIGGFGKGTNKGVAYVVYGGQKGDFQGIDLSNDALNPLTTGFRVLGNASPDQFGYSASTAGDINGDGYADILIAGYRKDTFRGMAYVIYGGEKADLPDLDLGTDTLYPASTGFWIKGNAQYDYFGRIANPAGDMNKDGFADIIIGAYRKNTYQGIAYVVYGNTKANLQHIDLSAGNLDPASTGFTIKGSATNTGFGVSAGTAGDINQDGYPDLIIGDYYPGSTYGAAYVIYGGASLQDIDLSVSTLNPATTGFTVTRTGIQNYLGYSVSTAGDINGDGFDDIIIGAYGGDTYIGAAYVIHNACLTEHCTSCDARVCEACEAGYGLDTNSDCATCPTNCDLCTTSSVCDICTSPYLLYQSQCTDTTCPSATFQSNNECKDCPSHCSSCTSENSCTTCDQGYYLSTGSLCILPSNKATQQAVASSVMGVGSVVAVGSSAFPMNTIISKIVQNTRYIDLAVTEELVDAYKTWETELISWDFPDVLSKLDTYKPLPTLFSQYSLDPPFLVNYWSPAMTMGAGLSVFIVSILLKILLEKTKLQGWFYSLLNRLAMGSFNFTLAQAYGCLDDVIFYCVLDIKTNPFNTVFSWGSFACTLGFVAIGGALICLNLKIIWKYQSQKNSGGNLEAFKEQNEYWELFYSDFNDKDAWSHSFLAIQIVRSSVSSLIITTLYQTSLIQATNLLIIDGAVITFLISKKPLSSLRATLAQYFYEIITLLVHLCVFILSLDNHNEGDAFSAFRSAVCTSIIYLNNAIVIGGCGFMLLEIYHTIKEVYNAWKLRRSEKEKVDPTITLEAQNDLTISQSVTEQRLAVKERSKWINTNERNRVPIGQIVPIVENIEKSGSFSGRDFQPFQTFDSVVENSFGQENDPSNWANQDQSQGAINFRYRRRRVIKGAKRSYRPQLNALNCQSYENQ